MVRRYDSSETAKLLLEAGAVEFAEHGIAGARVDKIADRAGVNKTAIYSYFGSKEELFAAAIEEKLGQLAEEVVVRSDNIPRYAGELFDFVCAHAQIVRLYEHEGMHFDAADSPAFDARQTYHQDRVSIIREAAPHDADAESIFLTIISMVYWFVAAPQVVRMIYGQASLAGDAQVRARYRAQIVETTRRALAPIATDGWQRSSSSPSPGSTASCTPGTSPDSASN